MLKSLQDDLDVAAKAVTPEGLDFVRPHKIESTPAGFVLAADKAIRTV